MIYHTEFDEVKYELERRNWHKELTNFTDRSIDVAIVRVRGHLIKFDEDALNTFLKTPVIIEEGEDFPAFSRFFRLRPDPQELAARLCIPRRGFKLNADGLPLKVLRKNLTMLAQTWSILSFSNLAPISHTSDITLDRARLIYGIIQKMDMNLGYIISAQISMIAQHDSSRLGFPALIIALCKARGVTSDSMTFESLSPAINLAYVKKNCWNLDEPSVTFRGPRKTKGKRSEAPPSSALPTPAPSTSTVAPSAPASSLPAPALAPTPSGPSTVSSDTLLAML
ncbi:hypothetical protein GmHk_03G006966 [Glycine max]|nr:hypothetical protein GmHk_03G006966 [Glycine max]